MKYEENEEEKKGGLLRDRGNKNFRKIDLVYFPPHSKRTLQLKVLAKMKSFEAEKFRRETTFLRSEFGDMIKLGMLVPVQTKG